VLLLLLFIALDTLSKVLDIIYLIVKLSLWLL